MPELLSWTIAIAIATPWAVRHERKSLAKTRQRATALGGIVCPTCHHRGGVKNISGASKAASVGLTGIFALGKLTKSMECKNCGARW